MEKYCVILFCPSSCDNDSIILCEWKNLWVRFFYTLYWINCMTFRYQNHRYGYYQEDVRKLHLNRCNGCVDGRTAQMCNKSSNRWNDIKKQRNCVLFVNELKWNALISINSRLEKPSRNCHERKRSNHSVFWQSWVLRRILQALII